LRRFLNWVVGLPVAVIIIGFAVANRQWVDISFDPFSREAPYAYIAMPLWALLFCGLFLGAIAGWAVCWLGQSKWRRAARDARTDLSRAREEHERLKREMQSRAAVKLGDAGP
jgi:uncharacterized integral membrane protein